MTKITAYTGVYIKKGSPAVCAIYFEVNGTITHHETIEMENVRGLCTLLATEIQKWQSSKAVMGDIDLNVLIHEHNKNAYRTLSGKVQNAIEHIPTEVTGEARKNLIKFYIRNKNYEKQMAYDQLVDLTNAILDYNQLPLSGKLSVTFTQMPGIGFMKSIWGLAQGEWEAIQVKKDLPSNVIEFRHPKEK